LFLIAAKNIIDPTAVDTAALCLFFDKLFDLMNGSYHKTVEGKIYRTGVENKSVHHELWFNLV